MPIIVTGALGALTAAILWLGTRVTDLGDRVSNLEGKITMLLTYHGG